MPWVGGEPDSAGSLTVGMSRFPQAEQKHT